MADRIRVRRILCPVDFSEFSARALDHAVRVASFHDATVRVLHVVPTLFESLDPAIVPREELHELPRARAARDLDAFVKDLSDWHVTIERSVRAGTPAHEIVAEAEQWSADLVVMGSHGRSGLKHLLLGSVTERVMHRVGCPVLAVGARETAAAAPPYRRILCPTKLVPGSQETVDYALALAAESEAEVEVLHVIEFMPPVVNGRDPMDGEPEFEGLRRRMIEEADEELDAIVPPALRDWCTVERRVATGDAAQAILEAARSGRAEVIVMGCQSRPLDRTLFGSTVHRVIREAPCGVLVLSQPAARRSERRVGAQASPTAGVR
jgi:nucleotide-binding universal stress UspA family protein